MKAQILTEDQIPEALSIARGVFDYCLRARITDLEMIHIFLQYTENTNIRNMIAEGTLTMWGIFEQGHMIAMSGMQKEDILPCCMCFRYSSAEDAADVCWKK